MTLALLTDQLTYCPSKMPVQAHMLRAIINNFCLLFYQGLPHGHRVSRQSLGPESQWPDEFVHQADEGVRVQALCCPLHRSWQAERQAGNRAFHGIQVELVIKPFIVTVKKLEL